METFQKRERDRRKREKRMDKLARRRERADAKLERGTGIPSTPLSLENSETTAPRTAEDLDKNERPKKNLS